MKKLVCDLCGESDFVKVEGMFECQVCGAKYSIDEAKSLFHDVADSKQASVNDDYEAPEESGYRENPVAQPKAGPTIVKKVIVAKPSTTQGTDPQAAKRIISQIKKEGEAPKKPGQTTVVKKVVVKPTVVAKPAAPQKKAPVARPTIDLTKTQGVGNAQMIENLLPIKHLLIRTKEIDTLDDYYRAIDWVESDYLEKW